MNTLVNTPRTARPLLSRNVTIALVVVTLHVALIYALQSGLLIRAAEMVVPAEILSQIVSPPASPSKPKPQPPAPTQPAKPAKPTPTQQLAVQAPAPQVQAAAAPAPTPAPTAAVAAAPAPAPAAPTPAAAPVLQMPSSDADYLQNPRPPYPPLSARLGETGKTVYKVWIGTDGRAQRAELVSSSGFPRLDKAAYDTVMAWRYVPGKRNGVAEVMAFNVPIVWELRN